MAGLTSKENGKKGGRPKGYAAIEAEKARKLITQKLAKSLEPIIDKAIEQAMAGDQKARDWLSDRAWGKTPQAIELPEGDGQILIKWGNSK